METTTSQQTSNLQGQVIAEQTVQTECKHKETYVRTKRGIPIQDVCHACKHVVKQWCVDCGAELLWEETQLDARCQKCLASRERQKSLCAHSDEVLVETSVGWIYTPNGLVQLHKTAQLGSLDSRIAQTIKEDIAHGHYQGDISDEDVGLVESDIVNCRPCMNSTGDKNTWQHKNQSRCKTCKKPTRIADICGACNKAKTLESMK